MCKKISTCLLSVVIAITMFGFTVLAEVPEQSDLLFVNDYTTTKVLSEDTSNYIITENDELGKQTGSAVVVTIVDFIEGEDIAAYTKDIFNTWGIGSEVDDNGILLLVSIGDDDYYAMTGYGINKKLTPGRLDDILYEYLEPDFAEKRYDEGIRKVFDVLVDEVYAIYGVDSVGTQSDTANPPEAANDSQERTDSQSKSMSPAEYIGTILGVILVFAVILIPILILIFVIITFRKGGRRRRRNYDYDSYDPDPMYGPGYRRPRHIFYHHPHHHHTPPPPPMGGHGTMHGPGGSPPPPRNTGGTGGLFGGSGSGRTGGSGAGRSTGSRPSSSSSSRPSSGGSRGGVSRPGSRSSGGGRSGGSGAGRRK